MPGEVFHNGLQANPFVRLQGHEFEPDASIATPTHHGLLDRQGRLVRRLMNAYAAGVAAGSAASAPPPPPTHFVMGTNYATLPAGCMMPTVGGATYYLCGNTWFKPLYGANGVYYRVVPTP